MGAFVRGRFCPDILVPPLCCIGLVKHEIAVRRCCDRSYDAGDAFEHASLAFRPSGTGPLARLPPPALRATGAFVLLAWSGMLCPTRQVGGSLPHPRPTLPVRCLLTTLARRWISKGDITWVRLDVRKRRARARGRGACVQRSRGGQAGAWAAALQKRRFGTAPSLPASCCFSSPRVKGAANAAGQKKLSEHARLASGAAAGSQAQHSDARETGTLASTDACAGRSLVSSSVFGCSGVFQRTRMARAREWRAHANGARTRAWGAWQSSTRRAQQSVHLGAGSRLSCGRRQAASRSRGRGTVRSLPLQQVAAARSRALLMPGR
jgi:hypothetical protein